ncbi:MAG: hypothetical protein J6S70_00615 [Clostridia bacterium]|nr:hypothetical protein [Clostridia bacterium]
MKKNWTMRVALLIVVLTLITSCFVGGTFAKYVTGASYEDTARVAKFGVLLSIEGEGFATKYATDDTTYTGAYTVEAEDKVVAPGTPAGLKTETSETEVSQENNRAEATDENKALTFGISGTPEVAVRINIEFGKDFKDVVLPKGTYTDYTQLVPFELEEDPATSSIEVSEVTEAPADTKADAAPEVGTYGYYETFKLDEDYYPIVYTLKEGDKELAKGSLKDIVDFVTEFSATADYAPGTVFDTEFTLTWEWPFESGNDEADTFLGNLAAGVIPEDEIPEGANTTINFALTITVTQID